ncbi:pumilio-like protein 1 [Platysternon megacephalum]|uniref:Pumilio-like protein 1 n=1 Tax=Platysternon megacephalum TaxID=55544 RepID=A0A4D9F7J9_9SAUR|nr:pumilio-like protein 1 [Platysternon megacephalum]
MLSSICLCVVNGGKPLLRLVYRHLPWSGAERSGWAARQFSLVKPELGAGVNVGLQFVAEPLRHCFELLAGRILASAIYWGCGEEEVNLERSVKCDVPQVGTGFSGS